MLSEQDGDQSCGREVECIVERSVALHGIADLKLHDRYAGQARRRLLFVSRL
jgi:hypothetical protein